MSRPVPWSVRGVDFDAREAAREAARRAGMTLGEWLSGVIAEHAAELGLHADDLDSDERAAAVAERLALLDQHEEERPRTARRRAVRDAEDETPPAEERRRRRAPVREREETELPRVARRSAAARDQDDLFEAVSQRIARPKQSEPEPDAEHVTERRALGALDEVSRRLEAIESRLAARRRDDDAEAQSDTRRALDAIQQRLDKLADARAAQPPENAIAGLHARVDEFAARRLPPRAPYRAADRSPMNTAVAEIARRQADLNGETAAPAPRLNIRDELRRPEPRRAALEPAPVARLRSEISTLTEAVADLRARPVESDPDRINALKEDVGAIAEALAGLRRETQQSEKPELDALQQRMAEMSKAMTTLAPRDAVASLETAVRDLSERVSSSRHDGLRESVVAAIEGSVLDLKRSLAGFAPLSAIQGLERQMAAMARIMETMAQAGLESHAVTQVQEQTREIHDLLVEAAERTASIGDIEKQITALSARMERVAERGGAHANTAIITEGIDQIRAELERQSPGQAFGALEARMDELSQRMDDALAHAAAAIPGMAALSEQIDSVRSAIENRDDAADVARLEALMRTMQARLDAQLEQPGAVAELRTLVQQVGQRLDDAAIPGMAALSEQIDSVRNAIENRDDNAIGVSRLEAMMRSMQTRLDTQLEHPGAVTELRTLVQQVGQRLDDAVSSGYAPASIGVLDEQLRVINQRLDTAGSVSPKLERLEGLLEHVAARLDQPITSQQLADVQQTLAMLYQRFDTMNPPDALKTLEARIAEISQKLHEPVSFELDLSKIEAMIQELPRQMQRPDDAGSSVQNTLRQIVEKLEAPVAAELDTSRLETMIEDIAARLDRPTRNPEAAQKLDEMLGLLGAKLDASVRPDAAQAYGTLEEQISHLAERVESMNGAGALKQLEQSVADIFGQIERFQATALISAEEAARKAARDALLSIQQNTGDDSTVRELLSQEISDLRAHQDAADRRTSATLNAVHETLGKVVERLAQVENEADAGALQARAAERMTRALSDDRSLAPAPAAPVQPAAPVADVAQTALSPARPVAPPAAPEPLAEEMLSSGPALNFAPAEARLPEARLPDAAAYDSLDVALGQPIEPAASKSPAKAAPKSQPAPLPGSGGAPDILLEPGSGKPQRRAGGATPTAPEALSLAPDVAPANSQASFIAAVRRAQQAASTAHAQQAAAPRPEPRGAAASGEEAGGSRLGRAMAMLSGRKRQVLLGLAGLVLILGAMQAMRMRSAAPPADAGVVQEQRSELPAPARRPVAANTTPAAKPAPRVAEAPAPAQNRGDAREDARLAMTAEPMATSSSLLSPQQAPGAMTNSMPSAMTNAMPAAPASPMASADTVASITRAPIAPPAELPGGGRDLRASAASGMADAQFELGARLADGRTMARDLTLAAAWLEKAALQNLPPAQYRLGALYEKGLGVPRDSDKAQAWYRRAADHGNVKAMHNLAVLLADGSAGKPDYAAAAQWFRRAAEHGVRDSQYNLAILSARGLGTSQDLVDSYVWFSIAAAQGDEDAGKKRADVAARLDTRQLSAARATADAFKPREPVRGANEVAEPAGGWKLAPVEAPKPGRGGQRPKISAL